MSMNIDNDQSKAMHSNTNNSQAINSNDQSKSKMNHYINNQYRQHHNMYSNYYNQYNTNNANTNTNTQSNNSNNSNHHNHSNGSHNHSHPHSHNKHSHSNVANSRLHSNSHPTSASNSNNISSNRNKHRVHRSNKHHHHHSSRNKSPNNNININGNNNGIQTKHQHQHPQQQQQQHQHVHSASYHQAIVPNQHVYRNKKHSKSSRSHNKSNHHHHHSYTSKPHIINNKNVIYSQQQQQQQPTPQQQNHQMNNNILTHSKYKSIKNTNNNTNTDALSDSEIFDLSSNHQHHHKNKRQKKIHKSSRKHSQPHQTHSTHPPHQPQPQTNSYIPYDNEAIMIDKNKIKTKNKTMNIDDDIQTITSINNNNNDPMVMDNISNKISLSPLQLKGNHKAKGKAKIATKDQQQILSDNIQKQKHSANNNDIQTKLDDDQELEELSDDDNDCNGSSSSSSSSSDGEFDANYPLKVIAFDLDKTMVRTISLHTNEQPQPEQHSNGYFMFFDDDTKEYHHVYKRPYLAELLEFLHFHILSKNVCKMMLCTHGTEKYAQTILKKCGASALFPVMLPRRDWMRRSFSDDYKPRRFKTIDKMAKHLNVEIEDVIMIDDDPGVYSKNDRCNGNLVHILPFDDPYEQRDDCELRKLVKLLQSILKYGKNYYNKLFANAIRYTGLVRTNLNPQQMAKHSLFRAQLLKKLIYEFNINLNKQERLGSLFLFDRFVCTQHIDWADNNLVYYVVLMFACLFIARQYLYTDTKRPKQFRRDPYSAEIWVIHVEIYERICKKYKLLNGYNNHKSSKHNKHHHHSSSSSRHKSSKSKKIKSGNVSTTVQQSTTANTPNQNDIKQDNNNTTTIYHQQHRLQHQPQQQQILPIQQQQQHVQQQQQQQMIIHHSYHSHSHHRRKRKHKHREKEIYFNELHKITKQICDGIGYPKLLHGLYHRPVKGYDSSLFIKYDDYVESLFRHIEKQQNSQNNPFINLTQKYD